MKNQTRLSSDLDPNDGVITLWIDAYSDIFSDFDPRPFSERTVSDDFIAQVKRVSRERNSNVSALRLLVPEGTQREDDEKAIKKRLQFYFCNTSLHMKSEMKRTIARGLIFTFSGIASMIIASYISFLNMQGFSFKLVYTLFEPAGWFLLWTGLDLLISSSGSKKIESQFYNKMENIHIDFSSYK